MAPECGVAMRTFGFEEAIAKLKRGRKVARFGWHGCRQCVYLSKGSTYIGPRDNGSPIDGVPLGLFFMGAENQGTTMPYLTLVTSQGNTQTGWLANQTEMLAEDWYIVG